MSLYDYDLAVIGAGGGGIISSKVANGLGKKVAMIEKYRIGGDCTWFGCVPSKALIRASSIAHNARKLSEFGLASSVPFEINADNVLAHVRQIREKIYEKEKPETFKEEGIDVIKGEAKFMDRHTINYGEGKLTAEKIIIATGSKPFLPPIEGLDKVNYLTNEKIFELEKLPKSMIVVGGGPIGVELAAAINRLGVKVTQIETLDCILSREDKELSCILADRLRQEGINIITNSRAEKLEQVDDGISVTIKNMKTKEVSTVKAETILLAVGRKADLESLNLEGVNILYDRGISVDDTLKTAAENIFACGDAVGPYQFSHMAEYQGVIAAMNAFLPFKRKVNYKNVLWCTYTDPELAHAGITEEEARKKYGDSIKIYRHEMKNVDRAITDVDSIGMSKFICDKKGNLLGAHILCNHAGELLHEPQFLKSQKIPFNKIHEVIHPYPTRGDAIKRPADKAYLEKLQNSAFIGIMKKLFT